MDTICVGRGATRQGLLGLLDELSIGAVIVDQDGFVIDQNECAVPHLDDEFRVIDRRIVLADRTANALLKAVFARVLQGTSRKELVVVPRARTAPSIISSFPIRRVDHAENDVLLLITDLSAKTAPSLQSLVRIFDLTPAEAKIAVRIAGGNTVREIAREANLAIGTVRFQLKSIFQKTRTHRQAELASLLTRLAAIDKSDEVRC